MEFYFTRGNELLRTFPFIIKPIQPTAGWAIELREEYKLKRTPQEAGREGRMRMKSPALGHEGRGAQDRVLRTTPRFC